MGYTEEYVKKVEHGYTIKVVFVAHNRLKYTHLGKAYPDQMQCVVYVNGLVVAFSDISRHVNDRHNSMFAQLKSLQLCFEKHPFNKQIREYFYNTIKEDYIGSKNS